MASKNNDTIINEIMETTTKNESINEMKKINSDVLYRYSMQPAYATRPIEEISYPAYATRPTEPIAYPEYAVRPTEPIAYPEYAVRPTDPIAYPAYATRPTNPITDISITYDQLEDNIVQLKEAINSLKSTWQVDAKKNINTLENSWVGAECKEYTTKLTKMDKKVNNTISALELLCSTYEQARDMLKDNQMYVMNSIKSID